MNELTEMGRMQQQLNEAMAQASLAAAGLEKEADGQSTSFFSLPSPWSLRSRRENTRERERLSKERES